MRKIFNYNKFNSDVQNTLVESFGALCNSYMDGKANTAEYQEANKQFTFSSVVKITKEINSYLPNLSTGEFKIKVDGIKFKCELARR